MTPQEASEELKEEFEIFKSGIDSADWENPNEELKRIIEANTMAIDILGQLSYEDCISRQAVKEMLTAEWTKYMPMELDMNLSFVLDKISVLPSVTPKTEWIPVSERLPEDIGGEYLVNIEYKGEYEGIDIAEYQIGGYMDGLWITSNDWIEGPAERWHVTAWMPLPQPYKESEDEK
jgi:Protein of unknown function (DUF551).